MWYFLAIFIILGVLFFLQAPGKPNRSIDNFRRVNFAHRGFFDADKPENSLAAFEAAVMAGYGIELDVRLTADKQLVVFHDGDLLRMQGIDRKVNECNLDELTIPTFSEVLELVGNTPILCEIKAETFAAATATAEILHDQIRGREHTICIESFHPAALKWFRKNAPTFARGQLCMRFRKEEVPNPFLRFALSNLLFNFLSRPHFLAVEQKSITKFPFSCFHKVLRIPAFVWTIRTKQEAAAVKDHCNGIIFENITPE